MKIKRKLYTELKKHLSKKEISIIVGPRQVGKTTIMTGLYNELKKNGEKAVFLNLDFEPDKVFFESQQALLNKIKLEIGDSGYVFIDEIQRKENAGLFLKGIYDLNLPYKFIVSGSGSLELKEKIREALTGRKRIFELYPVNFWEFVQYKTGYKYETKLPDFFEVEKERVDLLLNEYLSFGGYPRVVLEENLDEKLKVINEIFGSYIDKDIIGLLNIDRPDAFNLLIKILASQTGKLINYSTLASHIGISTITLKKYLFFAEKTFVIQSLMPFHRNSIKELTKSRTVYFYDLGLRNFANNTFNYITNLNDKCFLFQNLIKQFLEEQIKWKPYKLNFWRTSDKAEVDFVLSGSTSIIPVEVKYMQNKTLTVKRSLRSFINRYSPEKAFVINLNTGGEIKIDNTIVRFIPYYKLYSESIIR